MSSQSLSSTRNSQGDNRSAFNIRDGIGRLSIALLLGLTTVLPARGQNGDDEEWHPEKLYGPMMGEEEKNEKEAPDVAAGVSTAAGIAAWARLAKADGPAGRPLPLAGSWMAGKMFGPDRFVEMIESGHHMLPTFSGVSFGVIRKHWQGGNALDGLIESYRPALEYARKHKLPIALREWNWSDMPPKFQQLAAKREKQDIPTADDLRIIEDGKPQKQTDPFGPVEGWRAWGEMWLGNNLIRAMQEIYPDPPMVILLNNNEGPKVRNADQIPDDYPRLEDFLDGKPPASKREKERAIRQGYQQRYAAMFEAARDALVEPAWKQNVKFVAYNNLWDTGYIGQGNRPRPGIWFEPDDGWLAWRMYDGGMPELYDNDWQPGKTDYSATHSPQTEAMNYYAAQPRLFERDPDYYWSTIVWEGARVNNVFRGRRASSKPYRYITRGQRWDFNRYEGWVQFCLWTTRPRSIREFRWPPSDKHAYDAGTFMALVRSVDRPWDNDVLREFWRFGKLVPNPAESHPWSLSQDQPEWVRNFERWYLLTCDANPPRDQWSGGTALRVFAQALVRGDAPQRRWLIYAHAPLGAVPEPTVTVPGYTKNNGKVKLPSVATSGSFFLLDENSGEVKTLIPGGPAELSLQADHEQVDVGETVRFTPRIAHASGLEFNGFSWNFGDGETLDRADTLTPQEHTFARPGLHVVSITGHLPEGKRVVEEIAVHVGEPADQTVKYDLPLADAFDWEGPWGDSDKPDHELITYRHVPNAGALPSPVLVGGRFVEDDDRGRVLELDGNEHQGLWLIRSGDTVMDKKGHANQTLALRFKAADIDGRQMLYAQGYGPAGFNIYLDNGTLYAGAWATSKLGTDKGGWHPVWGRSWDGHWLKHEGIEAGRWYNVVLELRDATTQVEDGKQILHLDGETVATGPGVRVPRHYAPPRIGRAAIPLRGLMTRLHDGGKDISPFRGRLADVRIQLGRESTKDGQ